MKNNSKRSRILKRRKSSRKKIDLDAFRRKRSSKIRSNASDPSDDRDKRRNVSAEIDTESDDQSEESFRGKETRDEPPGFPAEEISGSGIDIEEEADESVVELSDECENEDAVPQRRSQRRFVPRVKNISEKDFQTMIMDHDGGNKAAIGNADSSDTDSSTERQVNRRSQRRRVLVHSRNMSMVDDSSEDANDDFEDDLEGSESGTSSDGSSGDKYPILAVLGTRIEGKDMECLVRWRDRPAYIHCSWVDENVVRSNARSRGMLDRFLQKAIDGYPPNPRGQKQYFDQSFLQPERLVAIRDFKSGDRSSIPEYFVKWKNLDYSECTWEVESDSFTVPPLLIDRYTKSLRKLKEARIAEKRIAKFMKFEKSPKFMNGHELRPYQLEGLNWLAYSWHQGRSSVLADEMGLGKTVQSVSLMWYLRRHMNRQGPILVVAPLSTIPHWQREIEGWIDLNCVIYHGSQVGRELIRRYEFYTDLKVPTSRRKCKFDVLVTTYDTVRTDVVHLQSIKFDLMIIDEAHRLKNDSSRLYQILQGFHFKHSVLLTGTPLQNNIGELWCILHFLCPQEFDDRDKFEEQFGDLKDAAQVEALHALIRPFLLRRMKRDVIEMAPMEETVIEVELTKLQKTYYRAIYERNIDALTVSSKSGVLPSLQNIAMQLRKCCNHPFTLRGVEEDHSDMLSEEAMEKLIKASGKMVLLDKLLPKLKEQGHRVLLFSQFVMVINIIEDYLQYRDFGYERIDGAVSALDRQAAIDRFSTKGSESFVFLLSTRAGGLGINLTAADTVIIFDSDWNPQNDLQALARCHRIGQSQSVKVYRLITRRTYEYHMFIRSSKKLGLDQAVLHSMSKRDGASTEGSTPMSSLQKKEIELLLRQGAYSMMDDDASAAEQFCSESIEGILARSSTITVDAGEGSASSFSKATFVPSSNEAKVELDDPEFWLKVGLVANDVAEPALVQTKRRRTVKSYSENPGREVGSPSTPEHVDIPCDGQDEADEDFIEMNQHSSPEDSADQMAGSRFDGPLRRKKPHDASMHFGGFLSRYSADELEKRFSPSNTWSLKSSVKFFTDLLNLGYERWNAILERGRGILPVSAFDVLRHEALCLFRFCLRERSESTVLRTMLAKDLALVTTAQEQLATMDSERLVIGYSLQHEGLQAWLKQHSGPIMKTAERMLVLRCCFSEDPDKEEANKSSMAGFLNSQARIASSPCEGWSTELDIALLECVTKNGLDHLTDTTLFEAEPPNGGKWPSPSKIRARFAALLVVLVRRFRTRISAYKPSAPNAKLNDASTPASSTLDRRETPSPSGTAAAVAVPPNTQSRHVTPSNTSTDEWKSLEQIVLLNGLLTYHIAGDWSDRQWDEFRRRIGLESRTIQEVRDKIAQTLLDLKQHLEPSSGASAQTKRSARYCIARVKLLTKVALAAAHPELTKRLSQRVLHKAPELPRWWKVGYHDLKLLRCVYENGFGNWFTPGTHDHVNVFHNQADIPNSEILASRLVFITSQVLQQ